MSSPYSTAITVYNKKAEDILAKKESTEIPRGMNDISSLQDLRRNISTVIDKASFIADKIDENQRGWQTIQNTMSITERIDDVRTQSTFVKDSEYIENVAELQMYIHSLKQFQRQLDVKLIPAPVVTPASAHPLDMPDIHKLHFLKECLKGRAANAISDLEEVEANYQPAIAKLQAEFGNSLAIKQSLYHSLQILKPTTGKRDDLRRFADELDKICSHLTRMGEDLESLLIQELIQDKLPPYLVKIMISSRNSLPTGEIWTTARIRQKLRSTLNEQEEVFRAEQRIRDLKIGESFSKNTNYQNHPDKSNSWQENPAKYQPTMSFMATNNVYSQNNQSHSRSNLPRSPRPNLPCLFCDSLEHYGDQCRMDLETRRQKLRESGRCFRCIHTGHTGNYCPNPVQCKYCLKSNHHPYLCYKNPTATAMQTLKQKTVKNGIPNANDIPLGQYNPFAKTRTASTAEIQKSSKHVHFSDENEVTENFPNSNSGMINTGLTAFAVPDKRLAVLKCSKFPVYTLHDSQNKSTATLFLDDGSTHSYITKKFSQKIGAILGSHCSLNLQAMTNSFHVNVQETKVCLDLRTYGQCEFQMLAVEKIADAIPYIIPPSNPDEVTESGCVYQYSEPDILIGNDYYYDINPIPIRKLPNGYVLLDSEIGILIGGKGIPSNYLSMTSQLCIPTFDPFSLNISCNSARPLNQIAPYSAAPLRILAQSKLTNNESVPPGFENVQKVVSLSIPLSSHINSKDSVIFSKMASLIKSHPDKDFSPSLETDIPNQCHEYKTLTKCEDNLTKEDATNTLKENLYIAKCNKEMLLSYGSWKQSSLSKHPVLPPSHPEKSFYFSTPQNFPHVPTKFEFRRGNAVAKSAADAAAAQVSTAEARLKTVKDIVNKIRNLHPKSDQIAQQVIDQEAEEKRQEREKKIMEEIQRRQNEANRVGQAGIEQQQTHQDQILGQDAVEQSQNQVGTDLVGDTGGYNIAHFHDDTYAQPAPGNSDVNCLNLIDRCGDPDISARCAGSCGREVNGDDHGENCADLHDLCNHEAYNDLMSTYCKNSCGK
ncbi:gag protein [Ditylenchus destructor]|uniref:Gag protein n=1 Tax=Ditylenchus destructor TaxID=166010 RepID=A0AAD4QVK2_9BILA|nr:gag protein [Ditylenchus destructor]